MAGTKESVSPEITSGKAYATVPTVDTLLDYVSRNMPNGAAGTLSANAYTDVVAFILSRNGLPAGTAELARDSAAGVQIIAKTGPGELPNGTLVRVVGCVARKEGGGWILNRATAPARAQNSDAAADDATRPLRRSQLRADVYDRTTRP